MAHKPCASSSAPKIHLKPLPNNSSSPIWRIKHPHLGQKSHKDGRIASTTQNAKGVCSIQADSETYAGSRSGDEPVQVRYQLLSKEFNHSHVSRPTVQLRPRGRFDLTIADERTYPHVPAIP